MAENIRVAGEGRILPVWQDLWQSVESIAKSTGTAIANQFGADLDALVATIKARAPGLVALFNQIRAAAVAPTTGLPSDDGKKVEGITPPDLGPWQQFFSGLRQGFQQSTKEIKDWSNVGVETAARMQNALSDRLASSFEAIVTGAKSAKEAFGDMARAIINDILRLIARTIAYIIVAASAGCLTT